MSDVFRVLFIRPPYTRLKGFGQAPYFPLGIGYLAAVANNMEGVSAKIYYPENPGPGEQEYLVDKQNVFRMRSIGQQRYFDALDNDKHPVWNEVRQVIQDTAPDLVGISVLSAEVGSGVKITEIVKSEFPDCPVVWGGVHPSFLIAESLEYTGVDYVIAGEGETALSQLIRSLQTGSVPTDIPGVYSAETRVAPCPVHLIRDLDTLDFPDRDNLYFPERFSPVAMGSIMHSRGCPWRCGFCSSRQFWMEKVRFRSAENVLSEIQRINRDFGVRVFTFWDDAFTADRSKTEQLCEAIIRFKPPIAWRTATRIDLLDDAMLRLMKRAGCIQLELGIETGSPRMLELIRKDIDPDAAARAIDRVSKHGIACGVFLMAGFPDETREDLKQTLQFMKRIQPAEIVLNIFDPMPGSEQYDRAIELGLLPQKPDFIKFPLWPDAHFVATMAPEEFNEIIDEISRYVFTYNSSRAALFRRAKPEILQLLRSDRKVLFTKGMRFLKRRLFKKDSAT